MADISILQSLFVLIAVVCICLLKIINDALLYRRFHFWLLLHDCGQRELEADFRLHSFVHAHVRDELALGWVEKLNRKR